MCRKIVSIMLIVTACLLMFNAAAFGAIVSGMKPYLQGVTTNSVYVLLECTTTDTVTVQWGPTTSYGSSATTTTSQRLDGLVDLRAPRQADRPHPRRDSITTARDSWASIRPTPPLPPRRTPGPASGLPPTPTAATQSDRPQ